MKKILIILAIIGLLASCCNTNQTPLPKKTEYMRIGFTNGKEIYLQIQGTGRYEIYYDNLVQRNVEQTCGDCGIEKIANNVTFFSVVTEQEYKMKHLGIKSDFIESQVEVPTEPTVTTY